MSWRSIQDYERGTTDPTPRLREIERVLALAPGTILEKANPAAPIAQMRRDMLEIKTEIAAIRQDIRDLVGLLRMLVTRE